MPKDKKNRPKVELVVYVNQTGSDIEFEIPTTPDGPMNIVECPAGGKTKGPLAYERLYGRHGLVLESKAKPASKAESKGGDEKKDGDKGGDSEPKGEDKKPEPKGEDKKPEPKVVKPGVQPKK